MAATAWSAWGTGEGYTPGCGVSATSLDEYDRVSPPALRSDLHRCLKTVTQPRAYDWNI